MVDEYEIHFRRRFVVEDGDIGKVDLILKRQIELREEEEKLDPSLRDYNKSLSEREKQILAIKKSFEAAEKLTLETATHPRNKSLKPISVTWCFQISRFGREKLCEVDV